MTLLRSHGEMLKIHEELSPKNIHHQFFHLPCFWWISLSMPFCWCLWIIWWTLAVTKSIQFVLQNLLKVIINGISSRMMRLNNIHQGPIPDLHNAYKPTRSTLEIQVDFSSFYWPLFLPWDINPSIVRCVYNSRLGFGSQEESLKPFCCP